MNSVTEIQNTLIEYVKLINEHSDIIMFSVSILFIISTYLQWRKICKTNSAHDLSYWLCLGNTSGLFILSITMLSINLYLTGAITLIQSILWFMITIQKIISKKRK